MNEMFLIVLNATTGEIETLTFSITEFASAIKSLTDAVKRFRRSLPKSRLYSKHSKKWIKFT